MFCLCTLDVRLDGRTLENKSKLILTEIFPSVQKHDIKIIILLALKHVRTYKSFKYGIHLNFTVNYLIQSNKGQ